MANKKNKTVKIAGKKNKEKPTKLNMSFEEAVLLSLKTKIKKQKK